MKMFCTLVLGVVFWYTYLSISLLHSKIYFRPDKMAHQVKMRDLSSIQESHIKVGRKNLMWEVLLYVLVNE